MIQEYSQKLMEFTRKLCNTTVYETQNEAVQKFIASLSKAEDIVKRKDSKCIRFCVNLNNRAHGGLTEWEKINWLPVNDRFEQCITSMAFTLFNNTSLPYMNVAFKLYMQLPEYFC